MTFIKNLIEKIKLWWLLKDPDIGQAQTQDSFMMGFQADLTNNINILEDEQQRKYNEAILTLKASVKKEAEAFESLEKYLTANPDLMYHASSNEQVKDIIRSSWDVRNKDVENEEDFLRMINTRIAHFYELQEYNKKRSLEKKIKLAKKQGDMLQYNSLLKEWKQTYDIKKH